MKRKTIPMLIAAMLLTACGDTDTGSERGKLPEATATEAPTEQAAPTQEAAETTPAETTPTEAAPTEAVPTEADLSEVSPAELWEYEGYVDEAEKYLWREEFVNKDYDGDAQTDRLYRTCDAEQQTAVYTIEFGNGEKLEVPQGWETGFPHIQSADLDGDGEKEILFTLSYDTSTYPPGFGDMWLFDRRDGKYEEADLAFGRGENGARTLRIVYQKPVDNKVTFTVEQYGFTAEAELEEDFIRFYWTDEAFSGESMIFDAQITEDVIHCRIAPFARIWEFVGFDLRFTGGEYRVENMTYPEEGEY